MRLLIRRTGLTRPHGVQARRSTWIRLLSTEILHAELLPDRQSPHYVQESTSLSSLVWDKPLENVLIVKKPWDHNVRESLIQMASHIQRRYPRVNILVEEHVADEVQKQIGAAGVTAIHTGPGEVLRNKTDLLVTLGGDGTILHATSMFASGEVPPVLSFSLGTLGFLLPFDFKDFKTAFDMVYSSQASVVNRARLACQKMSIRKEITHLPSQSHIEHNSTHVYGNPDDYNLSPLTYAMNDINIHRGAEPHLTKLDIHVDGEFITRAIADGVTIATPTGSTAYSLSSGGSIVHPRVACILLTPICPRSLSFRPLIFPATSKICITASSESRGRGAELSVDGIAKGLVRPSDKILVESETGHNSGIWCVAKTDRDWVSGLNGLLGFNSSFGKGGEASGDVA
ncbi:ATP-NAD kinase-like domain-containing protein [Yarrowia lipolytica]|uniref:Uncharacterized protein n=1 Tax=Yarrowia lipolytica TaxID=4952 RepID=A0A1H6QC27_YARLL|nr:hypothetical protein YALI1_E21312g [Yarrowia lipolytica]KAB8282755.1 ATP-NAD kinase-like domain-containing protein [Yarrowia lipolytica]KAE8173758.1 ATP-NAD kinase-like domain-containing protein [Yarrowia lipolytica]KAJ8057060.1 ATP-NAD kinase-like domain-containing protein [Yarrowia lipolytica]QNP99045.1 NAD kinase [Yarrowia lipolytica]